MDWHKNIISYGTAFVIVLALQALIANVIIGDSQWAIFWFVVAWVFVASVVYTIDSSHEIAKYNFRVSRSDMLELRNLVADMQLSLVRFHDANRQQHKRIRDKIW